MKKQVLLAVSFLTLLQASSAVSAQTRLALYEEFTGEQCIPCAIANPGLQSLLAGNAGVVHIAYATPFPAAGPIYNSYKAIVNARTSYYGITTTPQGRLDGTKKGSGAASPVSGHIANLTQSDITAEAALASPFNMTIAHAWSVTGDSLTATINITAPAAYSPAGASLKLRVALVERLRFAAAPGINGERDFPNVVRDLLPSPTGTAIPAAWAASQSNTYTITNRIARYIDKSNATLVAWIQNDADGSVAQAAVSAYVPIALDAATTAVQPVRGLRCVAGTASVASVAYLRNAGTATLTSAKIYYHADGGAVSYVNWTGSLLPNAVTVVQLGAVTVSGGNHYITDSVVMPNGAADINAGNNMATGSVSIYNTSAVNLPIVSGFEGLNGAIPAGWILYDADSNGRNFTIGRDIFGTNAGFGGSTYFLVHNNFYVPAGETNYAILPAAKLPDGMKTLGFAYAHASYAAENDKLEVVYSTDCGASWNTVWSAAGASLSTAPATTDYFIPTPAQWMTQAIDMSPVPPGAMIAFRAVSDYGNTLYIDNVRLESPAGVPASAAVSGVSLYPNPAADAALLHFSLGKSGPVRIMLTDATGRTVATVADEYLATGAHRLVVPTAALAAGVYTICIYSEDGLVAKRLSVLR